MFGTGILKGLGVTLKEFVSTYVDDVKKIPSRYAGGRDEIDQSNASAQTGLFTVQYPEERRKLSERRRRPSSGKTWVPVSRKWPSAARVRRCAWRSSS